MGIVAKKCPFPVNYRIIHNLSWLPQDSNNDHIDPDAFRCSFDDVVALIIKHEVDTLSSKLDLANAFKHILIRSQDWPLLGLSWDLQQPDGTMVCLYYVDLFLPFGLCSSPALFNEYADALQYTIKTNKVQDLLHYLDYNFTVGPPHSPVCTNNIETKIATCEELGFTVNTKKVKKPATTTNLLGVDINSVTMEARVDLACLSKTIPLLEDIMGHWSATKWFILSLIGKCYFICHVCRPGRAFLHHMIKTSMKAWHLHHRIKLNEEFHRGYLPTWNRVSLLYESHWLTSMECQLFMDGSNIGFGCYFQGHWCQGKFPDTCFWDGLMSINWRELYTITMALAIYGDQFKGKRILMHCDNVSVVQIMAKCSSKSKSMMVGKLKSTH